jgi:hypothetical protein
MTNRQSTSRCPVCDTPFKVRRKWNSGNPTDIELPECDCEADKAADEWLARFAARKERDAEAN